MVEAGLELYHGNMLEYQDPSVQVAVVEQALKFVSEEQLVGEVEVQMS